MRKIPALLSFALHALAIGLLLLLSVTYTALTPPRSVITIKVIAQAPVYIPKRQMVAGGGGADTLPASKGAMPRLERRPILMPTVHRPSEAPLLPIEPSLAMDVAAPSLASTTIGNPFGVIGPPSDGRGRKGMGDGGASGLGPGGVAGLCCGGGISKPILIYSIEPEFTEEAMKARFTGSVQLRVVITARGDIGEVAIVSTPGMGLEVKAIEAIRKWRFKPALKNKTAIPVQAMIDVNFRII